jgi:hypothetical protein
MPVCGAAAGNLFADVVFSQRGLRILAMFFLWSTSNWSAIFRGDFLRELSLASRAGKISFKARGEPPINDVREGV